MTRSLVLGIAGGSASGKSTVVEEVVRQLGAGRTARLPHDAYYYDLSHLTLEARRSVNVDHPDSLETELLIHHLQELRAGRSVDVPVYDFSLHTRTAAAVHVAAEAVIIVEGILVLAEPELRKLMDLRIYIDTDPDLRFIRRLSRDITERGRTVESVTEQYLSTVRPMHLQFVEPSKRYADIIVPDGYNHSVVGTVTSMIRNFLDER